MKHAANTDTDPARQPMDIGAQYLEMRRVKEEADRIEKEAHEEAARRRERRLWRQAKQTLKQTLRSGYDTFSLKVKRVHSLGDFYGRFHPSKSSKGIKRSE